MTNTRKKTKSKKAQKGTVKARKRGGTIKTSKGKKKVDKKQENKDKENQKREFFKIKHIDIKRVKEIQTLQEFLRWIASPRKMRKPKTQQQFAKDFGVEESTLSNWKRLDGFWDDVKPYRDEYFRNYTSEVLEGLLMRARLGTAKEVELFLKVFEKFRDTFRVEDITPRKLSEEEKEKIDKRLELLDKKIKEIVLKKDE